MRKVVFFLLFNLGFGPLTWAQINESDTHKFQVSVKTTGNYQTGNINVLALKGNLDFTLKVIQKWVYKSQNAQLYQELSKRKADNNVFSRNYVYYNPDKKMYPFAIAYLSTNFRRKIDFRYFVGAGLTYRPISMEKHVLKLAINAVYEESKFKAQQYSLSTYDNSDEIDLWRGTLYLGGWSYLLKKKVRFSYEAFYQPAFAIAENYRTQLSFNLDVPIWKGLYLSANYNYTHENVVPLGTKEDDTILTFGIGYNLKIQ